MSLVAALVTGCRSGGPAASAAASTAPTAAPATSTTLTTAPLPPPPYQVATTTIAFVDRSRPTVSKGGTISSTRALTTVVWAPAIGGRWPLVVFAAGYEVGPDTYAHLCRAWAAAGYVVAAPEFPLADEAVAGAALDENDLNNEPADATFVMTSLLDPASPWAARIDPTRIAVTGHSDGAEVALDLGQGGDPAIRAVIAMSGQPVVPHQAPNPPLLIIQGDQDTINPPERSREVYDQAASPRFLMTLVGGPHLTPFSGGSRWQPVVEAVTIDFLDHYLAGRTTSDAPMTADATRPGLSTIR